MLLLFNMKKISDAVPMRCLTYPLAYNICVASLFWVEVAKLITYYLVNPPRYSSAEIFSQMLVMRFY